MFFCIIRRKDTFFCIFWTIRVNTLWRVYSDQTDFFKCSIVIYFDCISVDYTSYLIKLCVSLRRTRNDPVYLGHHNCGLPTSHETISIKRPLIVDTRNNPSRNSPHYSLPIFFGNTIPISNPALNRSLVVFLLDIFSNQDVIHHLGHIITIYRLIKDRPILKFSLCIGPIKEAGGICHTTESRIPSIIWAVIVFVLIVIESTDQHSWQLSVCHLVVHSKSPVIVTGNPSLLCSVIHKSICPMVSGHIYKRRGISQSLCR